MEEVSLNNPKSLHPDFVRRYDYDRFDKVIKRLGQGVFLEVRPDTVNKFSTNLVNYALKVYFDILFDIDVFELPSNDYSEIVNFLKKKHKREIKKMYDFNSKHYL